MYIEYYSKLKDRPYYCVLRKYCLFIGIHADAMEIRGGKKKLNRSTGIVMQNLYPELFN